MCLMQVPGSARPGSRAGGPAMGGKHVHLYMYVQCMLFDWSPQTGLNMGSSHGHFFQNGKAMEDYCVYTCTCT